MPRVARLKTNTSIFHIMVRSISEIQLFNDKNDKIKYFSLIKKYQEKYRFKIYSYCLLDNHGHIILDCNGADVSKIMHGINLSYAMYFNRKYERHGHVFQDRFKSKIIDSDEYLAMVCAYIHGNPKDVVNKIKDISKYYYSSLREYLKGTNTYGILNKDFLGDILNLGSKSGVQSHLSNVYKKNLEQLLDGEFENEGYEYRGHRSILIRNSEPKDIIEYVAKCTKDVKTQIYVKYNSKYTHLRALSCFFMSCFTHMSQKNICKFIGNISQSRVSELTSLGHKLAFEDSRYKTIVEEFILA